MAKKKKRAPVEFEGVPHKPRKKRAHVAEEYREKGDIETARSLCVGLTRGARERVIA